MKQKGLFGILDLDGVLFQVILTERLEDPRRGFEFAGGILVEIHSGDTVHSLIVSREKEG